MTPENETPGTANGAPASWRSALPPEGAARGPGEGVNPRSARHAPPAPGQLPRFLRAHLASIVAITVAVTAIAAALAGSQTREYKSQAVVVVYPSAAEAGTGVQATLMGTEQAVVTSGVVVGAASRHLGVPENTLRAGLSVGAPANSYLLDITFTDPHPGVAQRYAQAVTSAYVAYRTPRPVPRGRATNVTPPPTSTATTVTPASLPAAPSSPNVALDTAVGLILGIVLALGFALARDRADDRLRGPGDLAAQSGARVLSVIPTDLDGQDPADGAAVLASPGARTADAFRDLRTRVVQIAAWQDARTIMVTSPEGEDEALVAGNLAAALALAGQHVVLVCADPSRAPTQELFGVAGGAGLASVVTGEVGLADAIQHTEVPGLEILPAGLDSRERATLMRASHLRAVMDGIRGWADLVIIDAPGVLTSPDCSVLAELADMVLLTADTRNSSRASTREAARELELVRPELDGCVLAEAVRRVPAARWRQPGDGAAPMGDGYPPAMEAEADEEFPAAADWRPSLVRHEPQALQGMDDDD